MKKFGRIIAGVATVSALGIAAPALADHAWSTYHWETTDGVARPLVVDNTTGGWPARVALAMDDWNQSPHIDSSLVSGDGSINVRRCTMTSGTIQVCNAAYGQTGWLGIASISLSGGHIVAGSTKLNDTYFAYQQYNTEDWKQLVTCQEIGHDYGLGHQNEDFGTDVTRSCMEYTSLPAGNTTPDAHDYAQLDLIYSHSDGGSGGGGSTGGCKGRGCKNNGKLIGSVGNTQAEWGRAIGQDANGRPNKFELNINGYTVITHVTWAPDAKRNTQAGHTDDH